MAVAGVYTVIGLVVHAVGHNTADCTLLNTIYHARYDCTAAAVFVEDTSAAATSADPA